MKPRRSVSATLHSLVLLSGLASPAWLLAEDETFDQRAERCLNYVAAIDIDWPLGHRSGFVRDSHSIAQARFAVGRDDKARQAIRRSLAIPWETYYDPEFPLWATVDCYLRWKDTPGKYTPELAEQTRRHLAQPIPRPARRGHD